MQVRYKHTGKIFAMKLLDKKSIIENEELDHAISEKNILQNLVHPFLVQLYFAFQTPDKICLVMDFINGGDIFYHLQVLFISFFIVHCSEWMCLQNDERFPPERTRFYTAQIVAGLEYMHSCGVVYRDLKAENLILNDDGMLWHVWRD